MRTEISCGTKGHLAADLHSNAEVTRGRCDGSTVDGSPSSRSGCRAIGSNAGVFPAHLDDGEKGAGSGPKASAGGHWARSHRERPCDGRHLGLDSGGRLRGCPAPCHPLGGRSLLERPASAAPPSHRVAPDRREEASCDTRCPERSGLGRSLRREQSLPGMPGIGWPGPWPWAPPAAAPKKEGDFRNRAWQSSRPRIPRIRMFGWSVVVLVGTSTCRIRRGARGLDSHRESGARGGLAGVFAHRWTRAATVPAGQPGQRAETALARAPDRSPCDGRRLDLGELLPGIDVPAASRDQAIRERDRSSGSGTDAGKAPEDTDRRSIR